MALEPPKATSCRPGAGGNPSKRADVWEPARVTFCKPEGRQTSLTTTKWLYPNDSQAAKYHFHCNFLPATHWLNSILITSCKDYWLILSLTVKEMVNWSIILSITKLKKNEIPVKGSTVLPFINWETTLRCQFPASTTFSTQQSDIGFVAAQGCSYGAFRCKPTWAVGLGQWIWPFLAN